MIGGNLIYTLYLFFHMPNVRGVGHQLYSFDVIHELEFLFFVLTSMVAAPSVSRMRRFGTAGRSPASSLNICVLMSLSPPVVLVPAS